MTSDARRAWARFVRVSRPYLNSEQRWRALGLLAALLALLLTMSGLNVVNNFVGRDFMTAIATKQPNQVYLFALVYLGVFAVSAAVNALSRFVELLVGLRWREWITERFVHDYVTARVSVPRHKKCEVDNPDERISEDLRAFTSTTLSFLVMATNSAITVVAFAGILWSITPWLLLAGVLYPLAGTILIVFFGHRLVGLNNQQLKKEADFRFELVQVRIHSESESSPESAPEEESRLRDRLGAAVGNFRSMISVIRNVEFVTAAYNYMPQLIPVLIVAPLYMRGEVEFGVVTQAAMAFSQVFNAFSLIATKFQDLSALAAVVKRVGSLNEALEDSAAPEPSVEPVRT